MSTRRKN